MELVEFLQRQIWEYKKAHPRYSSSQIAKLWGLSTSSFNRIENLETKKPSVEQSIRILKGVGLKDKLFETLGEFYPELRGVFLELSNHSQKLSISQADMLTQSYFENPDFFIVMALAASRSGISLEEIENKQVLSELLENKILIKRENGRFGLREKNIALNLGSTRKLLSMSINNCYDEQKYLQKSNWLSFLSESVDKVKVLPELVSILKDAHQKIELLFNDPKYQGTDTLFAGLVCDSMKKTEAI